MMSEMKPCPFHNFHESICQCRSHLKSMDNNFTDKDWQSRPTEDALQQQNAALTEQLVEAIQTLKYVADYVYLSDADKDIVLATINNLQSVISCKSCGQINNGQTGEYPCSECELPTTWDEAK